jgi:hypothetical protein
MLRPGLALNVAGVLVIVFGMLALGVHVLEIDLDAGPPAWSVPMGAGLGGSSGQQQC